MDRDQEQEWRLAIQDIPEQLERLAATLGAPAEYAGHRNFLIAFKRGVLMGMNPRLTVMGWWYTGEETQRAFRRGWRVGRNRIGRSEGNNEAHEVSVLPEGR